MHHHFFKYLSKYKVVIFLPIFSGCLLSCGLGKKPLILPPETAPETTPSTSIKLTYIEHNLHSAYRQWQGTPYVLGGRSARGVDCSWLVKIIFQEKFRIEIPSHTRDQLRTGTPIQKSRIRAGDLIFFQTGRRSLHVGVALGNRAFLHASTSSGVMISNLNTHYWKHRFFAARRIFDEN